MKRLSIALFALASPAAFAQSSGGTTIQCLQEGVNTPVVDYDYSWENGEMSATKVKIHFGNENDEFSWENWKFEKNQDPGGFATDINLDPTAASTVQSFISYEQPARSINLVVDRRNIQAVEGPSEDEDNFTNTYSFPATITRYFEGNSADTPVKCTASMSQRGMG